MMQVMHHTLCLLVHYVQVECLSYIIKKIIYPIVSMIAFFHKIEIFEVILIGVEIIFELHGVCTVSMFWWEIRFCPLGGSRMINSKLISNPRSVCPIAPRLCQMLRRTQQRNLIDAFLTELMITFRSWHS